MKKIFCILILIVSSASAGTNDVAVYRGIPIHTNIFTLLCQGRGNILIWRIDDNEVAIFNGRESVGHSIINTYNATTIEFNATLLSATTDSSSVPVRISSIDLNTELFGSSVIRCETNLGSSDINPMEESGSTTTGSIPYDSTTTEDGMGATTTMAKERCDNQELLRDLSSIANARNCDENELESFTLNLLNDILEYAKNNVAVMSLLQSVTNMSANTSRTVDSTELPSHIFSEAHVHHVTLKQLLFVMFLGLGNHWIL